MAFLAYDELEELAGLGGEICSQGQKGWASRDFLTPLGAEAGIL